MLIDAQLHFLEALAEQYGDMLTDYAWRFFGYRQSMLPTAQDAVQEVFIKAIRHVDTLMAHPNQAAWMKAALKHTLIGLYRSSKRRSETLCEDITRLPEITRQSMEDSLARWEQHFRLEEVLQVAQAILTWEEQQTFQHHFMQGLTAREAALLEEVSADTVRGRIFRIRKKMRRFFHLPVIICIAEALFRIGGA